MITLFVVLCVLHSSAISVEKPRFLTLLERAAELPYVRAELLIPNTLAAIATETPDYPAELLIALAWGESRLEPDAKTGHVCGVMQTVPAIPSTCGSLYEGYRAGVAELKELARDRRTHSDLIEVLRYRACGNAAFNGTCSKDAWIRAVLRRARRLGEVANGL